MKFNKLIISLALYGIAMGQLTYAQTPGTLSFTDFTPVNGSEKSWEAVADVNLGSAAAGKAKKVPGTGIISFNGNAGGGGLTTKESFGDAEVEFDFAVDKGATFGILFQGRYRVNLSDSWN